MIADRGYDSKAIVQQAEAQGMDAVIPPRRNRRIQRTYSQDLYRRRHVVENTFLRLKGWRGIATRYAKCTKSFLAAIYARCITLWAKIS